MATITVDDALLAALPGAHPTPAEQLRELAVVELYRRRVLSSGRAAELLGMGRRAFLDHAGRLGIAYVDLDDAEIKRELEAARLLE